ncbi:hypothetical protein [Actinobacillus vicugnae]|uniref:hypothetical protein n=1 Tax=Actinobacillus vicugnae TaxID=2573093 RepID=UPI001242BD3F|nr:hypothetical protein [Actinobacillus vicugnae]
MLKQIVLSALGLINSYSHQFNEWLFHAKHKHEECVILADVINSEIYLQKYGLHNFYQQMKYQQQLIHYVRLKEDNTLKSKFIAYERDILLPDEFEYYVLNISKNLKESLFFTELSSTQLDLTVLDTIFTYKLDEIFRFIEEKGDKLKVIFIDDHVAYICIT